jgi:exonuclease VII small subunit
MNIDDLKTMLNETQKKIENADVAGFKRAAQDAKICQERLKSAKRRLGQCKILLR